MSLKITVHVSSHAHGFIYGYFIRAQILLQVLNKQKELESCPKLRDPYTAATMAIWDLFVYDVFSKDWKNIKVGKYNGWCIMKKCSGMHMGRVVIVKEYLGKQRDLSDTVPQSSGS